MAEILSTDTHIEPQGHIFMPGEDIVVLGGGSGPAGISRGLREVFHESRLTLGIGGVDTGGGNRVTNALTYHPQFDRLDNPVSDFRRAIAAVAGGEPRHAAALEDVSNWRIPRNTTRRQFGELVDEFRTAVQLANPDGSKKQLTNAVGEIRHTTRVLGSPGGHTIGSLLLAGYSGKHGIVGGIRRMSELYDAQADVMPVAPGWYNLGRLDGYAPQCANPVTALIGEHVIDEALLKNPDSALTWLAPHPTAYGPLTDRIGRASVLATGPGSQWTSIYPTLLPKEVVDAIRKLKANGGIWVANSNLVVGEVDPAHWGAGHYVHDMVRHLGIAPDIMLYNTDTASLPAGELPMDPALHMLDGLGTLAIGGAIVGKQRPPSPHEQIVRSRVLTDGAGVARTLLANMPAIREHINRRDQSNPARQFAFIS